MSLKFLPLDCATEQFTMRESNTIFEYFLRTSSLLLSGPNHQVICSHLHFNPRKSIVDFPRCSQNKPVEANWQAIFAITAA